MPPGELTEVLNRPLSQETLGRDPARLGFVAADGTPRCVPTAFTWSGSEIVMCTATNAPKLAYLRAHPVLAPTIARLRDHPAQRGR